MNRPMPEIADSFTTLYVRLTFVGSSNGEDEMELFAELEFHLMLFAFAM